MKRFFPGFIVLVLAVLAGSCGRSDRVVGVHPDRGSGHAAVRGLTGAPAGVASETVALIAARTTEIGSVTMWLEGDMLLVQYETQASWVMDATHLAVAASIGGIPLNPAGNPLLGHFPYKQVHSPGVTQDTYSIDLSAVGLEKAGTVVLAAQADVSRLSSDGQVLGQEGAWGNGESFEDLLMVGRGGKGQGGSWAMHFSVNLNKLRGLVLWNRLGSQWEVEHSEVGPNGVITGSINYLPGKFGDGFEAAPRTGDHNIPNNFIEFPGLQLGQKGCLEFWYFPDWSNWQVGHIVELFTYGIPNVAGYAFTLGYNDWQELFSTAGYDYQGGSAWAQRSLTPSATAGWSTTQPFHLAITWDGTQPVQSDRLKLFLNGVPLGSFFSGGNATFSSWSTSSILRMAARLNSGDWNRHPWEGDHGVIDNLKVWNYPKTDFSDRFSE